MSKSYLDILAEYGVGSAHPGGMPITKQILAALDINRDTVLLDVGCGTGDTAVYIAKTYLCRVTAVDVNELMLKKALERFKRENIDVKLVKADAEKLPFTNGLFDIIISESVTAFTEADKSLKEYARILKRNGIFIAVEMTAETALSHQDIRNLKSVYGVKQVLTQKQWIEYIKEAGFREIEPSRIANGLSHKITSLKIIQDFYFHIWAMNYYRGRLGYRVYKCRL